MEKPNKIDCCMHMRVCFDVSTGPVSNVWLDPDSEFSLDKPVTCKANGYPQPTFRWMWTSNNETVARGAKLMAKSANHTFICRAENTVRGQKYIVMSSVVDFNDPGHGMYIHPAIFTTLPLQLF